MKIIFRKIMRADLEKIMDWRMHPDVSIYMYTDVDLTLDDQQKWFEGIESNITKKYWIINVDGLDVGLLGIYDLDIVNRRCEWAYYIASIEARGKGIGRAVELNVQQYVFEKLSLNKLCCEVFKWNDTVIKIHQKYGAQIEGIRVEHIYKNQKFHDVVIMSVLKKNWEKHIKGKFDFYKVLIEE